MKKVFLDNDLSPLTRKQYVLYTYKIEMTNHYYQNCKPKHGKGNKYKHQIPNHNIKIIECMRWKAICGFRISVKNS